MVFIDVNTKTNHIMKFCNNYSILSLLIVILFSCNSTKISSDYDRNANFSEYKTFGFTKASEKLPANELVRNRVFNAIRNNLKSKGLSESDTPNILIDLGLKTKDKKKYTTNNVGLSGFYGKRWRIGTGVSKSFTKEKEYTEGTLVINLIDAQKDKLLWMGSASGVINGKAIEEENLANTINKILASFPPQ